MFKNIGILIDSNVVNNESKEQEYFTAVLTGDIQTAGKLLNEGVDPNVLDDDGLTVLHIVAEKGDIAIGKYLLGQKTLDINKHVWTRNGDTPLITAVVYNREPFTSMLLQNGANPNIHNTFGRTALHCAVRRKNALMVKMLLFSKAQPNVVDTYGNTPLAWSVIEYPSHTIAEILLRWHADPNFRTAKADPLLLELALNCRTHEQLRMVGILQAFGVDVNIQNSVSRQTALHIVSMTGYVPLAQLLLKYGASAKLMDISGRSAYDVAVEHGHLDLIAFYKLRTNVEKNITREKSISASSITPKKKLEPSARRSVRFSEVKSKESDDELYLRHL